MRTELRTVVGCYGAYGFSIREQQPDHHFSQRLGMLAFGQPLHEYHVGASLGKCQDGPLAVLANYGVHLPVSETCPVGFCRALVDAYAVRDILYFCSPVGSYMTVVFHLVPTVRGEFSALVGTDMTIYQLVGYILATAFHIRRYLFGRPVILLQQIQGFPNDCGILCMVGCGTLTAIHCLCVSLIPQIVALIC